MQKLFRGVCLGLVGCLLTAGVGALPQDGQVVNGDVRITIPQGNLMEILQGSPQAIVNWGAFSIGRDQLVRFLQPNSQSAILNRVIGQNPSEILGQLTANGRVFLLNPNGILFGPGSVVDCGSFMASTLKMTDADFLAGRYNLVQDPNAALTAIANQGTVRVGDGGFLVLVSPLVQNDGLLVAREGQVVIGAVQQATLNPDGRGLLEVALPQGFSSGGAAPTGEAAPVVLTQGQMTDVLAGVVRTAGEADSLVVKGDGVLLNTGTIAASGGKVLLDSSRATVLTSGSRVSANGGEVLALSAGSARSNGLLQAQGGFIELSGHTVGMTTSPDVGPTGQFLLDPVFLTIIPVGPGGYDAQVAATGTVSASDPSPPGGDTVSVAALNGLTGPVRLEATQDIIFANNAQVSYTNPGVSTTLTAGRDILMNPGSSITAPGPNSAVTMNGRLVSINSVNATNVHINATVALVNSSTLGDAGGTLNLSGTDLVRFTTTTNAQGATVNVVSGSPSGQGVVLDANAALITGPGSTLNLNAASITGSGNISHAGSTVGFNVTNSVNLGALELTGLNTNIDLAAPQSLTIARTNIVNPIHNVNFTSNGPVAISNGTIDANVTVSSSGGSVALTGINNPNSGGFGSTAVSSPTTVTLTSVSAANGISVSAPTLNIGGNFSNTALTLNGVNNLSFLSGSQIAFPSNVALNPLNTFTANNSSVAGPNTFNVTTTTVNVTGSSFSAPTSLVASGTASVTNSSFGPANLTGGTTLSLTNTSMGAGSQIASTSGNITVAGGSFANVSVNATNGSVIIGSGNVNAAVNAFSAQNLVLNSGAVLNVSTDGRIAASNSLDFRPGSRATVGSATNNTIEFQSQNVSLLGTSLNVTTPNLVVMGNNVSVANLVSPSVTNARILSGGPLTVGNGIQLSNATFFEAHTGAGNLALNGNLTFTNASVFLEGANITQASGTAVNVTGSAANVEAVITGGGAPGGTGNFTQITSGNNLTVNGTLQPNTNVIVQNNLTAPRMTINITGTLTGNGNPSLTITQAGNITANTITGNFSGNVGGQNVSNAIIISDNNNNATINVNATNVSVVRTFPQGGTFNVNPPSSGVVNQPPPPPLSPEHGGTDNPPSTTEEAVRQVERSSSTAAALNQPTLGLASLIRIDSEGLGGIEGDNEGLTGSGRVDLMSPTTEKVVVSPKEALQRIKDKEARKEARDREGGPDGPRGRDDGPRGREGREVGPDGRPVPGSRTQIQTQEQTQASVATQAASVDETTVNLQFFRSMSEMILIWNVPDQQ